MNVDEIRVCQLHVGDCFAWSGACEDPPYGEVVSPEPRTYVKIPSMPGACGTSYNCLILRSWHPAYIPDDTVVRYLDSETDLVDRIAMLARHLDRMTQRAEDAQILRDIYYEKLNPVKEI